MTSNTFTARCRRLLDSHSSRRVLFALVVALALIAVFEAGVFFGQHQERSAYRWGEEYQRNFGGPAGGFIPRPGSAPNGHGTFGRIASTSATSFILTDPNHPEETIRVGSSTVIRDGAQAVSASVLSVGTYVVIIGAPGDDGAIDATLIRIIPAPPQTAPTTQP